MQHRCRLRSIRIDIILDDSGTLQWECGHICFSRQRMVEVDGLINEAPSGWRSPPVPDSGGRAASGLDGNPVQADLIRRIIIDGASMTSRAASGGSYAWGQTNKIVIRQSCVGKTEEG